MVTSRYIHASWPWGTTQNRRPIARSDEGGKVLKNPTPEGGKGFEKPQSRGGKGFEKIVKQGSLRFENRHPFRSKPNESLPKRSVRRSKFIVTLVPVSWRKSIKNAIHEAKLISYLKTTGLRLGLLLNFHEPTLKQGLKRIVF
jgi:hypothetical protein